MNVIEFNHVYKYFYMYAELSGLKSIILNPSRIFKFRKKKFFALKDLSFVVRKGESVGVIGRNGSGKSTVLALIAGVLSPSSGSVVVNGKISPLLELGSGFHPELSGVDNIILNGILLGMKKEEILGKMDSIVEFSELGDFIKQPLKTYSSGMVARLAFSIAVHVEPEILLIDEILAVGDFKFQEKCFEKMAKFKDRKVTIVFVSHSESDVKRMCDRVILLEKGRKVFDGDVEEGFEVFRNTTKGGSLV